MVAGLSFCYPRHNVAKVYDVFLSYNTTDRSRVEAIADKLQSAGIEPWLATWNVVPGTPWQSDVDKGLKSCRACAVFIGPSGIGPWQQEEVQASLERRVKSRNGFRVIPVLLPGGRVRDLPMFLSNCSWVDFRSSNGGVALLELEYAIRGIAPGALARSASKRVEICIRLEGNIEDLGEIVSVFEKLLKAGTGDPKLTIKSVRRGSIVLVVDASREAFEILRDKVGRGVLSHLGGFKILSVDLAAPRDRPRQGSQPTIERTPGDILVGYRDRREAAGPGRPSGYTIDEPLMYLPRRGLVEYRKGQSIFDERAPSRGLHLIVQGRVKTSVALDAGPPKVVEIFAPDDFFGESSLLPPTDYRERAAALDSVILMSWTDSEIKEQIERQPLLGIALLKTLVKRHLDFEERLESLATEDIPNRVVRALIHFADRLGATTEADWVRIPPLTHQVIAEYVATTREAISSHMNRLRRSGLVRYSRRGIEVHIGGMREWLYEQTGHWSSRGTGSELKSIHVGDGTTNDPER